MAIVPPFFEFFDAVANVIFVCCSCRVMKCGQNWMKFLWSIVISLCGDAKIKTSTLDYVILYMISFVVARLASYL